MPGILNIGNTCYIASAVQLINRIKPLRKSILEDTREIDRRFEYVELGRRAEVLGGLGGKKKQVKALRQWELEDREVVKKAITKLLQKLQCHELSSVSVNPKKLRRVSQCECLTLVVFFDWHQH